jgi:hypothetical protein
MAESDLVPFEQFRVPMNKHKVTDSRGQVHKRNSRDRVYTHCVVIHFRLRQGTTGGGHSRAEWAGVTPAPSGRGAPPWHQRMLLRGAVTVTSRESRS